MRAVWIRKHGGPNVLEVRETEDPEAKAGEVRVRAKACGLNFAEVTARQGMYPDAPKPPCVVGYEGAGVVDQIGAGVRDVREGDRVIYMTKFWGHSDTVVVPAAQLIQMPDEMSFEHGAALPVNYLTAYHMLFEVYRLRKGDRVLIHMAAGGVGTAALQLCRSVEGVTTFGTSSAAKHDHLREQGCTHPIDYRTEDYVEAVRKLTNGEGVDLVLDALGGDDWRKGYSLLRKPGMLIAFGLANVNTGGTRNLWNALMQLWRSPKYKPLQMMTDNKAVAGVNLYHLWDRLDLLNGELAALIELYRAGTIVPHIDGVFPFEKAAEAHGRLEYGKNVGKVLLAP